MKLISPLSSPLRLKTQSINIRLLTEPFLLGCYLIAHRQEAMFADASHHNELLRFREGPVFLTMFNDPFGEALANARQGFEFFCRSGVDVDA